MLSDGAEFICDSEHRWVVWDDLGVGKRKLIKATTGEMYPRHKAHGLRNRYAIDVAGPLTLPKAELPIDPYLLGVWLGNGSAWMNQVTIHEDDTEFCELLGDCGFDVEFRLPEWRKGKAANLLIDGGRGCGRDDMGRFVAVADPESPSFMTRLRQLALPRDKHIPAAYLRASVAQRLALLQGLMDTDGHCSKLGRCEFSTANPALRDGVYGTDHLAGDEGDDLDKRARRGKASLPQVASSNLVPPVLRPACLSAETQTRSAEADHR